MLELPQGQVWVDAARVTLEEKVSFKRAKDDLKFIVRRLVAENMVLSVRAHAA